MEFARSRKPQFAGLEIPRSKNKIATPALPRRWRSGFRGEPLLFVPAQRALEAVDGELSSDDSFEVRAADVVIQLRHFEIPMKNGTDRGQGGGQFYILV